DAGMVAPPGAVAGDHDAAPDPGSHDQQGGADIKQRMRLHRRIEGIEHAALPAQDGDRGRHRSPETQREGDPGQPAAGDPSQTFLRERVTQSHDEEGGEDQRHEHAVGSHRQIVERFAAMRKRYVGDRERLQHAHGRGYGEGRYRDPNVGGRQGMPSVHGNSFLTISLPTMLWCMVPQYSLQPIRYSPGFLKVTVNWLT